MSVETAAIDRLPWLPDEPAMVPVRKRSNARAAWTAVAIVAAAAAGSWLGFRSASVEQQTPVQKRAPIATVQLPAPRPITPEVRLPAQPEVSALSMPDIRPSPSREVRIAPAPRNETPAARAEESPVTVDKTAPAVAAPVAPLAPQVGIPKPWEPRVVSGAAGRLVQVGAFGSVLQAKQGWRYMVRAYPALSQLPAVVRPTRNSKGRVFYRFRIGTTSQAHSEILCQRMQRIELSCAVVGLPWKAKVER